ncbi:MAG: hypothetical protein GPJ27_09875 [Microcystis aeruginosa L111-01]|jgi:hypothetical protein|nr:hypothetical protein [Microcystis aeruginosa W13-16]NCQ73457.1 hypothetical protein [Microcystis aeruginosa W13-13]NCQ77946.1 hypothetical protein [Microcystis aeruginosa W13-15]NCR22204.1 hypothetical protein [Microcystis aeruginosa L111-01]NCR91651.1 hypothetical protein [Microcystis aeruginosa G13-10]NCS03074.1 hypothetical protein [Microcystis aeruginosa G13-11]NCS36876.1 hypothetical protein [Microcystis aeruginosa G11-01]NCT64182.1 hypothetical protein [Microcystis aeruginosa G13-01
MNQGIDYFNRGHWLTGIQERLSVEARRKMFDLAMNKLDLRAGESIIDIGSTPDVERIDSNCMIPWFHEAGLTVALSSPEDISSLSQVFPFAKILSPNGFHRPVLAKEREFDVATSSAVLEHCGSTHLQVEHIRECARVASKIFLTTPNRWHWLEFHTKLPLIHWLPKSWHRFLLNILGLSFWAKEDNLNLLDRAELLNLAKQALGDNFSIRVETIWALGMPSNLVLLARRIND